MVDQVLFIQLSRLGDCLQSTPLLAAWRQNFPEDRLVVLVREENAAIFQRNPHVSETILFNPPVSALADEAIDPVQRLLELENWLDTLKSRRFRVAVNLTHNPFSCWVTTALGTREIRGLCFDAAGRMGTRDPWGLYAFSMLKFRKANLFNLVDSFAHLSGRASTVSAPAFPLDPESLHTAEEWLSGCAPGSPVIGFQPGANLVERRWPAENFISVGQSLASEDIQVIVFGSKAEEDLGREIAQNIPGAISFAGKTTIPQLAALLARCGVLVTNDTGTMHLGAAVGTRILAVFESSAYFRETGPYGTGHWVIQSPQLLEYGSKSADELAGIRRIPPDEVLWAVHTLLKESCGNESRRPSKAPPKFRAHHFRSVWESGYLDFHPVQPVPLDGETVCSYLQKPVWLAALDNGEFQAEETAASVLRFLHRYYTAPSDAEFRRIIAGMRADVQESSTELKHMKQLLRSSLEKVRRNPKYKIPQGQITELNQLEQRLLQKQCRFSVHGFLGYFEIGLAMVGGGTMREYLEQYLRPLMTLERQLFLFDHLLTAISRMPQARE